MFPCRQKHKRMGVRPETRKFPQHLAWVRRFACSIVGPDHVCMGKIEAHHVREHTGGGVGLKPPDWWAIPLCASAHRELHNIGHLTFAERHSINLRATAEYLARISPHRKRWELTTAKWRQYLSGL